MQPPEVRALAADVVRAERTWSRNAARDAARSRIWLARYADAVALVALLAPWVTRGPFTRDGLHVSTSTAALGLMGVALRQIVLTAVAAQPDRRSRPVLGAVAGLTAAAGLGALLAVPDQLAAHPGSTLAWAGPTLFIVGVLLASAAMASAGIRMARGLPTPDLLTGRAVVAPEELRRRLAEVRPTGGATLLAGSALPCLLVGALIGALQPTLGPVGTAAVLVAQRPPWFGVAVALAATALLAGVLYRMHGGRPDDLAMGGAFVGGVVALVAAIATAGAALGRSGGVPSSAGWLATTFIAAGAALTLLAGSALYEALHRDPLPADLLDAAEQRLTGRPGLAAPEQFLEGDPYVVDAYVADAYVADQHVGRSAAGEPYI